MAGQSGGHEAVHGNGKNAIDAFEEWGYAAGRKRRGEDVALPPVPMEYVPWFRMNVTDLSPREYWSTAQEDMELCLLIQHAVQMGEMRADEEARKAQKEKQDKAERERRTGESMERSRAKAGLR